MWRAVDLFSGAGGFSLGLRRAGFTVSCAVENFPLVVRTYRRNFPETPLLEADISTISGRAIEGAAGGIPHLVAGSPPCQSFTAAAAGRREEPLDRLYRDGRGKLTLQFIRLAGEMRPNFFVMENVPAAAEGPLGDALREEFRRAGWPEVHFNIIDAGGCGVPSRRTRLFVSNLRISSPEGRAPSVLDALHGLPPPGGFPPNHEPPRLGRRRAARLRATTAGRSAFHFRAGGRTLSNWLRLRGDRPSPTVMASSRFIHPLEDRLLTARETARLMGFPDDFEFCGGRRTNFQMIGEAVPVQMAEAVGKAVAAALVAGGDAG